jgi:hypothetical protein
MDPNETLKQIRELLTEWWRCGDREEEYSVLVNIVDKIEALDDWITSGGFLPADWQH